MLCMNAEGQLLRRQWDRPAIPGFSARSLLPLPFGTVFLALFALFILPGTRRTSSELLGSSGFVFHARGEQQGDDDQP